MQRSRGERTHARQRLGVGAGDVVVEIRFGAAGDLERQLPHHLPPYSGPSFEVITKVQRGDYTPMKLVKGNVPSPLDAIIRYISQIMTLEPGDLVATGTPAGVGALAPGDVVEVEIPGVSKVTNPVAAG